MRSIKMNLIMVVITLILCFSLVGCTKGKKIVELKEEITTLISNNKYDDAMVKYDEILALDNSPIYMDEKNDVQILKYKTIADEARKNGELKNAIETYEKILEIKETDDIISILSDVEEEQEAATQVKAFYDELFSIKKERIRSGIKVSPTDMEYIIKDLRILTKDFEEIDDFKDTEIARHIKNIKESYSYQLYKIQVDSTLHDNSGLDEALGELDSEMDMINTLAVAKTRNSLNESIDKIIEIAIPEMYK